MKTAALFLACLSPFLALVYKGLTAGLGVNPPEYVLETLGWWALMFFVFTLSLSPLGFKRRRRMVGLFTFFYAFLHFLTYLTFDAEFDWPTIVKDVSKRPYITVGFAALCILAVLAITSTDGWIRRLKIWWPRLHMLVYPAAILGVVHYYWLVKSDKTEPLRFAAVIAGLLAYRIWRRVLRT